MNKTEKKHRDRNTRYKPWSRLIPYQVPPEAAEHRVVACFQNHLVTVFVKETESGFTDDNGNPSKMVHLMVKWSDPKRVEPIPYRYKMRVKDEILGEHAEAVELYPARWREQEFKQDHMWGFLPGTTFPLGIVPTDMNAALGRAAGGSENVVTKEELELFVVKHAGDDGIIEVFASEDDCKVNYGENPIPEGATTGIEMIGKVPPHGESAAWSYAAIGKLNAVMSRIRPVEQHDTPELFYEHDTVEDEIWEDVSDEDPPGLEENLAIASAMREALENRSKRVEQLKAVTDEVAQKGRSLADEAMLAADKPRIIIP